ncbi:MAG: flavodoxin family protein [Alphaproteobacteria bacterium]|nr:flavodoxin family protein [Alphaproteobacteria bacterium]
MNVLLINGSPNEKGCTYTALSEVIRILEQENISTTLFHIGKQPIQGCIGCGVCRQTGKCIYDEDKVNSCLDLAKKADGIIVGSPVYYAGPNGALCAFLDRLFFASNGTLAFKPAAAIVSSRRAGGPAAFDRLNKYFTISHMPIVSSQYWNEVHGSMPADVLQDAEGLQTMRSLARNMAWLLRCIQAGQNQGITYPEKEEIIRTNFIR